MTTTKTNDTRQAIIDACLWMNRSGINQGTSGNISVRAEGGMLITPSGIPYDQMTPDMLRLVPLNGEADMSGSLRPSTEWRFHQSILRNRPDMNAVVHAHPVHATSIAIQRREIPACHYMVAAFGGTNVPLVDYALFGGVELAEMISHSMQDRTACLLANHGAVVAGESLARALWRMDELENLAKMYILSMSTGTPYILTDAEMADVIHAFANYGPKDPPKDA